MQTVLENNPVGVAANTQKYIDGRNHCPCGCTKQQLNDYGYCCHLVGFTNHGKVYEVLRYNARGQGVVGGQVVNELDEVKRNVERVLPKDKLVNPVKKIVTKQGIEYANEWVSSRVYRDCPEEQAKKWRIANLPPIDEDVAAMDEDEV